MTVIVRNQVVFRGGIVIRNSITTIPEVPYVVGGNVSTSGSSPSGTDPAYMDRVFDDTPTNSKIWTFSAWVKRSLFPTSGVQAIIGTSSSNFIGFNSTEVKIQFNDSTPTTDIETNAHSYDVTDWQHFVVAIDTTQAVASDRVKVWLNNKTANVFDAEDYPDQNEEFFNINGNHISLGRAFYGVNGSALNGNIAEVVFVDGQALDPTDFATDDETFGWTPINYAGTYGNNGFHLTFLDANLGLDTSGNGNHFTNNGCTTTADSPTSNYPTLDFTRGSGEWKLSTGYLTANNNDPNFPSSSFGDAWLAAKFSTGFETGKWYFEAEFDDTASPQMYIGLAADDGAFMYYCNNWDTSYPTGGYKCVDQDKVYAIGRDDVNGYVHGSNGSTTSVSPTTSPSSKFMVAIDCDSKKIWFGENGNWLGGGDPAAGTNETYTYTGNYVIPFAQLFRIPVDQEVVFVIEEIKFNYTMPTGFTDLAESNKSLPARTDQADFFGTLRWTGDGTSPRTLTGLNFTPDFIILKMTSGYSSSPDARTLIWDSETNMVFTPDINTGTIPGNDSTLIDYGTVTSAVGGITITTGSTDERNVNLTGEDYVAYCFKKAPEFFDIVTYTDNSAQPIGELTIGHNLGVKPGFMIVRATELETDWHTYHKFMPSGASQVMKFNADDDPFTTGTWNSQEPTSTTFRVGDDGDPIGPGNGGPSEPEDEPPVIPGDNEHVCYLFGESDDLIKYGIIRGNNNYSLQGTFIYTGFRPAFVLAKTDDTNTVGGFEDEWFAFSEETIAESEFYKGQIYGTCISNDSDRDNQTFARVVFVSNGFYLLQPDNLDASMIWMAIAAEPERRSRAHLPGFDDTPTIG